MRSPLPALALLVLPVASAFSQDARPSAESVQYLFGVMHTSQLLEAAMSQVDTNIRATLDQATRGQQLNAQQQKIRDDSHARLVALMKEGLDWSHLEPMMVEVYRNTFTADEIAGMVKFYDSPTGRAVTAKQPQATQQMMQLMQARMRELMPQLIQLQKDTAAQIRAAGDPDSQPPASAPPPPPH